MFVDKLIKTNKLERNKYNLVISISNARRLQGVAAGNAFQLNMGMFTSLGMGIPPS